MNSLFKQIKLATQFRNIKFTLLTTRMSSTYLIDDPKYSFLKELGLERQNFGVFSNHGRWFGDGEVRKKSVLFNLIF